MLQTKNTNNKKLYIANVFLKNYISVRSNLTKLLMKQTQNEKVKMYLDLKESKEVKEYLKTIHDIQELDFTARKYEKEIESIEISQGQTGKKRVHK